MTLASPGGLAADEDDFNHGAVLTQFRITAAY